jgi:GT2 family glycosyltransferase/SAM-dependent methyltransferase
MSTHDRWEIMQVRLDRPLRALAKPLNAAGAYLVFWWNDIPLGHALVFAGEFPLNEADLQRRASRAIAPAVGNYLLKNGFQPALPVRRQSPDHDVPPSLESLATLSQPLTSLSIDASLANRPSVSVIVCTRRRPEQLRRCLEALRHLDPAPTEIIVVDNGPEECRTREVVKAFGGVIYLAEPTVGLSRARNSGILRSSGAIVAFTDDDVLVHPRWLLGVREALSQDKVFGMTGLVLAGQLETRSQVRFEFEFGGFNCGYRPITFESFFFNSMLSRGVPVWRIGAGANMAFRRAAFIQLGLFDTRLGAGASGCSEDSEFWYRMLATGMLIAYEPRAVVWHLHRIDSARFRNQMTQYMRGHVTALLVQFEKHRHFGNIWRLIAALPYYYCRRLARTPFKRDLTQLFSELLGYILGFATYFGQPLLDAFKFFVQVKSREQSAGAHISSSQCKRRLPDFLSDNPFPHPYTEGLFYREKMRAIHSVAPAVPVQEVLEVGGGRSGLTSLLYPSAQVVNIDLDREYQSAPCNQRPRVRFVCGDATDLPFADESFDAVTMFDLLEHVVDDRQAVREAFRVLRPGGFLLVSTPNENWRYPYYRFMKRFCPREEELFAEWGHVRRGYSRIEIEELVEFPASRTASFINPLTVLCHDIGFSRLSRRRRQLCWALLTPITLAGYLFHRFEGKGTETAYVWMKPQVGDRSGAGTDHIESSRSDPALQVHALRSRARMRVNLSRPERLEGA